MLSGFELTAGVLAVGLFGAVGSVIRHLMGMWQAYLPWGILAANSVASFIAGASIAGGLSEVAIVVGLAGGLSTFSTFAAQSYELLRSGHRAKALLYGLANLLIPAGSLLIAVNLL